MIVLAAQIAATVIGDIDVIQIAKDMGAVVDDLAHDKCPNPVAELFIQ